MTGRMMTSINVIKLPDSVSNITGIEGNGEVTLKGFCEKEQRI